MNFDEYCKKTADEKFNYFINNLYKTNRTPSYWVNWNKVENNITHYKSLLNKLDSLSEKKSIKDTFKNQPDLLKVVPILLATQNENIDVLSMEDNKFDTYNLDFENINLKRIDSYINFIEKTGLFEFLEKNIKGSLIDYAFGVQAGLDSNARKNRGGTQNEIILERNLKDITRDAADYINYGLQKTSKWVEQTWQVYVPEVLEKGKKGGRRYDAVVFNKTKKIVTIIETNFYGSSGSKLKSVAGEFTNLYKTNFMDKEYLQFVWITDGPGWKSARNPLMDAFKEIPIIINLKMVRDGFLKSIIE